MNTTIRSAELFDDLEEEKGKDIRDFKCNDLILQMKQAVSSSTYAKHFKQRAGNPSEAYDQCVKLLPKSYTPSDIDALLIFLDKDDGSKYPLLGMYISALMNNSGEDEFTISPRQELSYLGYRNDSKRILIKSEAPTTKAGWAMRAGRLELMGIAWHPGWEMSGGELYAENSIGVIGKDMRGGKIYSNTQKDTSPQDVSVGAWMTGGLIVHKGIEKFLGPEMKGGVIVKPGLTTSIVGTDMESGEIHLHGGYKPEGFRVEGKKYHELCARKGGLMCYGCDKY